MLFDWDGCLAQTLDMWLGIYQKILRSRGIELADKEVVDKTFGLWAKGFARVGVKDSDNAYAEAITEAEKLYARVDLYPGAKKVLSQLSRDGVRLALGTSSFIKLVLPALEYHQLTDWFEVVLTRDDVIEGKPQPELVEKVLSRMGAGKQDLLVVGDSYHDVQMAKNAKVDAAIVYPLQNRLFYDRGELEAEKPTYLVESLADLVAIINGGRV